MILRSIIWNQRTDVSHAVALIYEFAWCRFLLCWCTNCWWFEWNEIKTFIFKNVFVNKVTLSIDKVWLGTLGTGNVWLGLTKILHILSICKLCEEKDIDVSYEVEIRDNLVWREMLHADCWKCEMEKPEQWFSQTPPTVSQRKRWRYQQFQL